MPHPEAHRWRTQREALSHRKNAPGRPGRLDGDGGTALLRYLRLPPPSPVTTHQVDEPPPRDERALLGAIRRLAGTSATKRFRVPLAARPTPPAGRPPRVQRVRLGDRWVEVCADAAGVYQVRELPPDHHGDGTNVPEVTDLQP
jgi:hypothetical protein